MVAPIDLAAVRPNLMRAHVHETSTCTHPPVEQEDEARNEKYNKRLRKRRNGSSLRTKTGAHYVGLLVVLLAVWYLWRASQRLWEERKSWDRWNRRSRAEQVLKLRLAALDKDSLHHRPVEREENHKESEDTNHDRKNNRDNNREKRHRGANQKGLGVFKHDAVMKDLVRAGEEDPQHLEHLFKKSRHLSDESQTLRILHAWLAQVDQEVMENVAGGIRWIRPYLLPPLPDQDEGDEESRNRNHNDDTKDRHRIFFRVDHEDGDRMAWEDEWDEIQAAGRNLKPVVDYTNQRKYNLPPLPKAPPISGDYPHMTNLKELLTQWPQNEDYTGNITETLLHFDYNNPREMAMARKLRDEELPFKVYNVPELIAANVKWTDDYVQEEFDKAQKMSDKSKGWFKSDGQVPPASGVVQESPNHYFAFFTAPQWYVTRDGLPPTLNYGWSYRKWAQHARYADAVQLQSDKPHFYFQAGVDREERHQDESKWSFISHDLPSWSSPDETFMSFHPNEQKGIQCRFGERGVTAATHYDSGRNIVGMITGAKRYILSPPRECSKLGLHKHRKSPIFRHSLLDFGHFQYMEDPDMSLGELTWLKRAATSQAVETVLKTGEALYIPSFWFHYIVSLQKSAQCNVRSGVENAGTVEFGGHKEVDQCRD